MKTSLKIVLLIVLGFFLLTFPLLVKFNPFILAMFRIVLSALIIGGGILLFRNKWSHKLPREKRKAHLEEYKKQFRKK